MVLLSPFIMKIIIFNDKQNFDGSLNSLNKRFKKGKKRFWNYEKYIPFLVDKLKSFDKLKKSDLQLKKTLFYTGRYSSKLINSFRWTCNQKISELNFLIKKQQGILDFISQQKLSNETRKRINKEFGFIKKTLEEKKQYYIGEIGKQKRNYEGQKELLSKIAKNPFIEVKTTPLKQAEGKIYQKGVDVMIATDLVNLAHTNAYDVALILGGDTDFIECIKLVKDLGKIVVVSAFHSQDNPLLSTISDLKNVANYFLNLNDLSQEDLIAISDQLKA